MNKLPQIRPKDLLKFLEKQGFRKTRQTGSHAHLKHPDGRITSIFTPRNHIQRNFKSYLKTNSIET